METEWKKVIPKTIVVVFAGAILNWLAYVAQVALGFGPASAVWKVEAGSPAWFAAVDRWLNFDRFALQPILVALGAAVQRWWCPRSPIALAVAVIIPAIVLQGAWTGEFILIAAGYSAIALIAAAVVDRVRGKGREAGEK